LKPTGEKGPLYGINMDRIEVPETWRNRAERSIAQGALTNSKRPQSLVEGVYPTHLLKGKGPYVWDSDGNKYIDLIAGLGTSILGYAHPEVDQAATDAIRDGLCLSLSTTLEVRAAERIREYIPYIERVKFLKTGTEACMAALKIARSYTNRNYVRSQDYHGWSDPFVSLMDPASGVPKFLGQNNHAIHKYEKPGDITQDLAAVIIEPVNVDFSPARVEELKEMRKRCDETGTMLIFDEIITGFRFSKKCVTLKTKVKPDLLCMGKAIANGYPLALVGGKKEIMDNDQYFVSGTYCGERASLAAMIKVIDLLHSKYDIEFLWEKGQRFKEIFNNLCGGFVWLDGYGTRNILKAENDKNKALFMQECCKGGLLLGPSVFYNFAHTQIEDSIFSIIRDVMNRIKGGMVSLEGKIPSSPFAQKMRGQ